MSHTTAIIQNEDNYWYSAITDFGIAAKAVRLLGIGSKFYKGQRVACIQCGNEFGFTEIGSYKGQAIVPDNQKKSIAANAKASVSLARLAELANNKQTIYKPVTIQELFGSKVKANDTIYQSDINNFYVGARGLLQYGKQTKIIGWWNCLPPDAEETDGGVESNMTETDFYAAVADITDEYSRTKDGKFWNGNPLGAWALQGDDAEHVTDLAFEHDNNGFDQEINYFPHRLSVYPSASAKAVSISRIWPYAIIKMELVERINGVLQYSKPITLSPVPGSNYVAWQLWPVSADGKYIYMKALYYTFLAGTLLETKYIRWLRY